MDAGDGRKRAVVTCLRFPDGGAWLDQECFMTDVFAVIADSIKRTIANG